MSRTFRSILRVWSDKIINVVRTMNNKNIIFCYVFLLSIFSVYSNEKDILQNKYHTNEINVSFVFRNEYLNSNCNITFVDTTDINMELGNKEEYLLYLFAIEKNINIYSITNKQYSILIDNITLIDQVQGDTLTNNWLNVDILENNSIKKRYSFKNENKILNFVDFIQAKFFIHLNLDNCYYPYKYLKFKDLFPKFK